MTTTHVEVQSTSKTTPVKAKGKRSLDLTAPAKSKGKKLSKKQEAANRDAAKPVKVKPASVTGAKNKTKERREEAAQREYAKLWNPATNKTLAMKKDLEPHKRDYDSQLSMKHFGLALLGITQATDSYIKHRVGAWGLKRLIEKSIVSPAKGKDGVYNIDRAKADERYGKFLSDLPVAAAKK